MSVRVMGLCWELVLPPSAKLVLLALADNAKEDGTKAYPGVGRLVRKSGLSRRSVQVALRLLEAEGIIESIGRTTGGTGHATEYTVHPEKGVMAAPFAEDEGRNLRPERAQNPTSKGVVAAPQPSLTVLEPSCCDREGCDRPQNHPGPHRDPWYEAIGQAVYPGETIPDHQTALAGKLAARARKAHHPPERILQAAAWIADKWGAEKLTLGCLNQHYERASGLLAQNTEQAKGRLRRMTEPKRPEHVHEWGPHFKNPTMEVCACGERRKV